MKLGDFCPPGAAQGWDELVKLLLVVQDESSVWAPHPVPAAALTPTPCAGAAVSLTFRVAHGEHGGGRGTEGWSKATAQIRVINPN